MIRGPAEGLPDEKMAEAIGSASLQAKTVRATKAHGHPLDVEARPTDEEPGHASVVRTDPPLPGKDTPGERQWIRAAQTRNDLLEAMGGNTGPKPARPEPPGRTRARKRTRERGD